MAAFSDVLLPVSQGALPALSPPPLTPQPHAMKREREREHLISYYSVCVCVLSKL